jgi:small subunit ribosomal protein S9
MPKIKKNLSSLNKADLKIVKIGKKDKKEKKQRYYLTVGRRKRSVARIKLFSGKGLTLVNNEPIEQYFSGLVAKELIYKPLNLVEGLGKFYVNAKIIGGGKSSQLGAYLHGLSRALCLVDEKYQTILRKESLLTRDPREKERRKPGNAGKARKKKQSPKR